MYKTIKGISRALAIAAVQNEALETRRKWISKEAFGEEEKAMAEKIAAGCSSGCARRTKSGRH